MERLVYLAGPITGITYDEASDWRSYVQHCVNMQDCGNWLKVLSPMRGKCYLKDMAKESKLEDHYSNKILSTSKGITCRDRNDVIRCDLLFVNFLGAQRVSIGTVMEIAWADILRKPIIICMEKNNLHQHSMINESVGFITDCLDEGIHTMIQVLRDGI